jgi:hypothetical protein
MCAYRLSKLGEINIVSLIIPCGRESAQEECYAYEIKWNSGNNYLWNSRNSLFTRGYRVGGLFLSNWFLTISSSLKLAQFIAEQTDV